MISVGHQSTYKKNERVHQKKEKKTKAKTNIETNEEDNSIKREMELPNWAAIS